MHLNDSRLNNNNKNNSYRSNNNTSTSNANSILNRNTQDNDGNSASVMSNLSSYSLIDDDHIDDQETINVGNLIIDLEVDLEQDEIQKANAKPTTCTTTSAPLSSSSSLFGTKASSSISTTSISNPSTPSGKLNQKSSGKHSNISINNPTSNSNNNSLNNSSTITNSNNANNNNNIVNNNINNSNSTNNNGHLMTTRTVFKSSADERGELKMRITRETKPGKSEHKIVTSPNQKSPTSSSCSTNTSHANNFEDTTLHDIISKPSQSSSISSTKECGTSTSIGTITEPDCLGPCEPGTSVTLEGIVWQETDGGILVVNVTWRGKTYVGALLDCTKHDWAPPRLCDSPASDIDSKAHKGVRTKRIVTRSNGIGLDEKNLLQTTGKLRNGKGRRILTSNDLASCNKRQRESDKSNENIAAQAEANTLLANVSSITNSETACVPMNIDTTPATNNESISTSNISTDKAGPNSPMLISCSEPNCSKKYRNMNGLLYHQAHAHGADNDSNNAQDNNCSSSDKITTLSKNHLEGERDITAEDSDHLSPTSLNEPKQNLDVKPFQGQEKIRTPSPQLTLKISNKIVTDSLPSNNALLNPESCTSIIKNLYVERRSSSSSNHSISNIDHGRRSPGGPRHLLDYGHGSNNHSSAKSSSSGSKQSNPVTLPVTTEEGMKPSGTSTGPPPAPHQANCYFNSSFLANTLNPYGLAPYYRGPSLPMYDPLAPPGSAPNAAFLTRFMNTMRVPQSPESPSRLLSPSMSKNLPFSHFKVDPGQIPVPTSQMANPSLPNMSPHMINPPLGGGSPLLRMPSQGDPMLPPISQPPFPPQVGMNSTMGLPGSVNPMGHIGSPQVPSLVDDPLAKHFPRRFN